MVIGMLCAYHTLPKAEIRCSATTLFLWRFLSRWWYYYSIIATKRPLATNGVFDQNFSLQRLAETRRDSQKLLYFFSNSLRCMCIWSKQSLQEQFLETNIVLVAAKDKLNELYEKNQYFSMWCGPWYVSKNALSYVAERLVLC